MAENARSRAFSCGISPSSLYTHACSKFCIVWQLFLSFIFALFLRPLHDLIYVLYLHHNQVMDFLRRSIHTKDAHGPHISTPIPSVSKPSSSFHQPPKKVIRALEDHRSQAPHQLSFSKGDFFHVINEIDQGPNSGWYEANNPVTGARGLVPKVKFEEFNKSNAA